MSGREREELRRCIARIRDLPDVARIVLFGSYAKGTQNADSDVDLAVFFNTERESLLEEYRTLVRICSTVGRDVQVQAFRLSELDDPCGIFEEILGYGIDLGTRYGAATA